jgi:hypothetical protein
MSREIIPTQYPHDDTDKLSVAFRIKTCKECDKLNNAKFCVECGCFMPAKVRIPIVACPLGKWDKVTLAEIIKASK